MLQARQCMRSAPTSIVHMHTHVHSNTPPLTVCVVTVAVVGEQCHVALVTRYTDVAWYCVVVIVIDQDNLCIVA
jgi:hypothetical protein